MPEDPRLAQQAQSRELVEGVRDSGGEFEGMPRVRSVAGDLKDQRVKGKVAVITGMFYYLQLLLAVEMGNCLNGRGIGKRRC